MTPQSEPLKASRLLVDDFAAMVNRYLQDPSKHILSDQASTNDVLVQIESIQRSMHGLNSTASTPIRSTAVTSKMSPLCTRPFANGCVWKLSFSAVTELSISSAI